MSIYPCKRIKDADGYEWSSFEKTIEQIADEVKHGGALKILKPDEAISEQQRKWLHCKDGPIRWLVSLGWDFAYAKIHLKVAHGRAFFVTNLTDENFKKTKGVFFWECRVSTCRAIWYPYQIRKVLDSRRYCPNCDCTELTPIAIKSIIDVTPTRINKWFDNIFVAYPKVLPPDPEWKKKPKELK